MNNIIHKLLNWSSTLVLLLIFSGPASAVTENIVRFSQGSLLNVDVGSELTVDLVGTDFTSGPDGVAFSLAWNPSVLSYKSTSIANPPWDTSFISADNVSLGTIDYVFLNKTTAGNAGFNFSVASFNFSVIGKAGDTTFLTLNNDPFGVGFVAPGAIPIPVNYIASQVQVVPVPAAIWLFVTGLVGLIGRQHIKKS